MMASLPRPFWSVRTMVDGPAYALHEGFGADNVLAEIDGRDP